MSPDTVASVTAASFFREEDAVGACRERGGSANSAGQKVFKTSFKRGNWMGFETKSSIPASWQL
jgi:hypothetical protein